MEIFKFSYLNFNINGPNVFVDTAADSWWYSLNTEHFLEAMFKKKKQNKIQLKCVYD